MKVKVWNDNVNEYSEKFREKMIIIPGKGFINMEEDEALLPFGVDLGSAVTLPSGFAVAGIRGQGQAFVEIRVMKRDIGKPKGLRIAVARFHMIPALPHQLAKIPFPRAHVEQAAAQIGRQQRKHLGIDILLEGNAPGLRLLVHKTYRNGLG